MKKVCRWPELILFWPMPKGGGKSWYVMKFVNAVKLGDKECFDKEQIDGKEPFPVINCQFTSKG